MFNSNLIFIINLCGEIIYILDQRLHSQNTPIQKSQSVLNQIIKTLFKKEFLKQIITSKLLFSIQFLQYKFLTRALFNKTIHNTLMKINDSSFRKLIDLSLMSVKLGLILIMHPCQIYSLTLNYIKEMKKYTNQQALQILKQLQEIFQFKYKSLSPIQYFYIKKQLLNVMQFKNPKISLFLKLNFQNNQQILQVYNRTCPQFFQIPGTIKYIKKNKQQFLQLQIKNHFQTKQKQYHFSDWETQLGMNIYNGKIPNKSGKLDQSKKIYKKQNIKFKNQEEKKKSGSFNFIKTIQTKNQNINQHDQIRFVIKSENKIQIGQKLNFEISNPNQKQGKKDNLLDLMDQLQI